MFDKYLQYIFVSLQASLDTNFQSDDSIYNSSFETEFDDIKPNVSKKPTSTSLMLSKALKTTKDGLKQARECSMYCLRHMAEEDLRCARNKYWTKTKKNRLEWFLDKVSESKRKNNQIYFLIEGGKKICSKCFQTLHMISRSSYFRMMQKFKSGATTAGVTKGRKESEITEEALRWLNDYAYFHSDRMPDTGYLMLPYRTRKNSIYKMYDDERTKRKKPSVSEATFYKIWKKHCPKLKIKKVTKINYIRILLSASLIIFNMVLFAVMSVSGC